MDGQGLLFLLLCKPDDSINLWRASERLRFHSCPFKFAKKFTRKTLKWVVPFWLWIFNVLVCGFVLRKKIKKSSTLFFFFATFAYLQIYACIKDQAEKWNSAEAKRAKRPYLIRTKRALGTSTVLRFFSLASVHIVTSGRRRASRSRPLRRGEEKVHGGDRARRGAWNFSSAARKGGAGFRAAT